MIDEDTDPIVEKIAKAVEGEDPVATASAAIVFAFGILSLRFPDPEGFSKREWLGICAKMYDIGREARDIAEAMKK